MFVDDISQSLPMGDLSQRKSHITKINRTFLGTRSISSNKNTNEPVKMSTQYLSSVHCSSALSSEKHTVSLLKVPKPEHELKLDEHKGLGDEKESEDAKEACESKNTNWERKRRKDKEEKDEQCALKRLKTSSVSDLAENASSRGPDSPLELGTALDHHTSKRPLHCETHPSNGGVDPSLKQLVNPEKSSQSDSSSAPCNGTLKNLEPPESASKLQKKDCGVMRELEARGEGASQEDSEAVSALLASQESEQLVSMEATCVLLHASPMECDEVGGEHERPTNDPEVSDFTQAEPRGQELNQSEVKRSEMACSENKSSSADKALEEPKVAQPIAPIIPCNKEEDVEPRKSSPSTIDKEPLVSLDTTQMPSEHPSPCSSPKTLFKPAPESSNQIQSSSPEVPLHSLSSIKRPPKPYVAPIPTLSPSPFQTPIHSPPRTPNRTPTPEISTKSSSGASRKEPFTIYRDPALVRAELVGHLAYVHPPRTPPNPKLNHKTCSPSCSSPSITSASSHSKLLSPSPHPAHLSPIPLHSQPGICSLSTTPHSTIPHPHLLPSLLPALSSSAQLLAGHSRMGALGLPHHPLALPSSPSLLGQTSGGGPLAPLGIYPLLWPPFPNGAHGYPGLALQASKWTPHEGTEISDSRRNISSQWLSQPTPVTNADAHIIQAPLPIRPSSADPLRSRSNQHSTPPCKTTEELDRRGITESTLIHSYPKTDQERIRAAAGRNGQTFSPVALDSPSRRMKQPLVVYDLTGERPNSYLEENRRILLESSEVAPFTAKLGSEKDARYTRSPTSPLPSKEREKEMDREQIRDVHAFRNTLPHSAHHSPSSYYTSLSNSMESRPQQRRVPASKELYERLTFNPALTPSSQISMRARPPPLVKRQQEKGEGLLGKITEQLAHKASESSAEKKGAGSSLISVSSPRSVPLLHRAPIFHPPAPANVVSKDPKYSKVSPPTLSPVQPMSLNGKGQKQQRPPTLSPEFKDSTFDGKRPAHVKSTLDYDSQWAGITYGREKAVEHVTSGGVVKPQVVTASVIVRPASHTHTAINYSVSDSSLHVKSLESLEKFDCNDIQQKRGVLWTPLDTVHPINMTTQKRDLSSPINMTNNPIKTAHSSTNMNSTHPRVDLIAEQFKRRESGAVPPKMEPSPTSHCRDFPHLKKHRAGLAAPRLDSHLVGSEHTAQMSNSMKQSSVLSDGQYGSLSTLSAFPASSAHASIKGNDSSTVPPAAASPVTNQSSQSSQNNYHKLKKAWLTRHSEQDRGGMVSKTLDSTPSGGIVTKTNISLSIKEEEKGLVNKNDSLEMKKAKLLEKRPAQENRKPSLEDRKSNSNTTCFVPEDKKFVKGEGKPVTAGKKSSWDDVKPVLERIGKVKGKDFFLEDKKPCAKRCSVGFLKKERENRGEKRPLETSGDSESREDSENDSENGGTEKRVKLKSKTSLKARQNDNQKKKVQVEVEEEAKLNGNLPSPKEKAQRLSISNGIPRSILKDWRKVRKLKQTGEAFLQDDSCVEIGSNVQKCRECRLDRSRKTQEPVVSPVFCRFYHFRRLSYSKNGVIRVDGFSVPEQTDEEAVSVWSGSTEDEGDKKRTEMDLEMSKFVLALIGDKFCQLVKTENTALSWVKKDTQIMWKRAVRGVREMCDACEASLFNMHWACHKCGFVVCMDCFKAREKKKAKDKELYVWVRCVKNQPHDIKNLMPTQIVPDTILLTMQNSLHSLKEKCGMVCLCTETKTSTATTNGLSPLSDKDQSDSKSQEIPDHQKNSERREKEDCDGLEAQNRKSTCPEQGSTLRDLLTSTAGKLRLGSSGGAFAPVYNFAEQTTQSTRVPNILDDIIASVVENKIPPTKMARMQEEETGQLPETLENSENPLVNLHTSGPYDWLGAHRMLWLKEPHHPGNHRLFKEYWAQEQPVLVSGLHKSLDADLWKPELFSREFSSLHSDIYNCRDGSITNSKIKDFWDGFEDVSKRPKCAKGELVVFRLKDWPSGEEFLALMPSRYHDVMKALPVPEYTQPEAHLNLASHLPSFFIRPDLGPRLCCAHGVTSCPEQDFGTSCLHVEISDTMSILVYVGVAKGNGALSKSDVSKLLEEELLDDSVRKRLKDPDEIPGALWHIYMSKDLQKIQEFLQKVDAEQHSETDPDGDSDSEREGDADPLREGCWYLSPSMRRKLQEDCGVESHTLLQFHGDAVIIPAGALHQVMNLHSCIQVNVDFVSPEHAHNSYYLTQELRPLRDQVNYEDKLQVKNIFYHSVKDAMATLKQHESLKPEQVKQQVRKWDELWRYGKQCAAIAEALDHLKLHDVSRSSITSQVSSIPWLHFYSNLMDPLPQSPYLLAPQFIIWLYCTQLFAKPHLTESKSTRDPKSASFPPQLQPEGTTALSQRRNNSSIPRKNNSSIPRKKEEPGPTVKLYGR
ncbi:hypothetical protein DNTS_014404 [Danionella cerebrum]|uniref:JmjC domain-containing protein n=1 Tax=Danionella cerebrum TaxID=2873325 RepID=A0A553MXK0_9TELE|nr:hypothetical protein DNTS_014404 [Danionella translucida]